MVQIENKKQCDRFKHNQINHFKFKLTLNILIIKLDLKKSRCDLTIYFQQGKCVKYGDTNGFKHQRMEKDRTHANTNQKKVENKFPLLGRWSKYTFPYSLC